MPLSGLAHREAAFSFSGGACWPFAPHQPLAGHVPGFPGAAWANVLLLMPHLAGHVHHFPANPAHAVNGASHRIALQTAAPMAKPKKRPERKRQVCIQITRRCTRSILSSLAFFAFAFALAVCPGSLATMLTIRSGSHAILISDTFFTILPPSLFG